jgi:hypothetical protein
VMRGEIVELLSIMLWIWLTMQKASTWKTQQIKSDQTR